MKKSLPRVLKIHVLTFLLLSLFLYKDDVYAQTSAKIKFSNSYVNITKNMVGGTVEPGDVLEIRTTLYINGTYNATGMIYYLRYVDNLPSNTGIVGGSTLDLITNEGLAIKNYSQPSDADAGTFLAAPPPGEYQVKINMGGPPFGVASTAPANNSSTDITGASDLRGNVNRPKFGGGTLISTAFRVQVTGAVGDTITLGAGQLLFKKTNLAGDPDTAVNAIQYKILIAANESVCPNTVGANFAGEFGGTFGDGNTLNRAMPPSFLIPGYTYIPNVSLYPSVGVNDGFYAIVNNSSPKSATNIDSRRQPTCGLPAGPIPAADSCNGRMFGGFWFISGDHTGTTDAIGNPPAGPGSTGGYMLEVNADIATTEAYRQTISGLCPDTYYEFSAWVKNICPLCGIDSTGAQTWKPGVLPNLTFVIDDIDRYSSGEIDTLGWQKKGFLFKTNPGQTSITISIRDNAPGGGGNDWVLDDINLATCSPNLALLPSPVAATCYGDQVDLSSLISSHFDNYIYWQWEESVDNGSTWTNTGVSGTGSPLLVAGEWQYTATYPSFLGDSSVHNNQYRVRVATSVANLSDNNCSFSAITVIKIKVNNCQWVLDTKLLSFNAKNQNGFGFLTWVTEDETNTVQYQIEKSIDGIHFSTIGTAAGRGSGSTYHFTDPGIIQGPSYYRIKITDHNNYKYSRIETLNARAIKFDITSLVNPFDNDISFSLLTPTDRQVLLTVLDSYGKMIKQEQTKLYAGINKISIGHTGILSSGTYILRIQSEGQVINRRIVKTKK